MAVADVSRGDVPCPSDWTWAGGVCWRAVQLAGGADAATADAACSPGSLAAPQSSLHDSVMLALCGTTADSGVDGLCWFGYAAAVAPFTDAAGLAWSLRLSPPPHCTCA